MTNFATFIDTGNGKAPDRPAGQGQAEALRPAAGRAGPGGHPRRRDPADLARLPRRPARCHPVPRHDRPLRGQYEAITRGAAPQAAGRADMTVVFDAGQNCEDNFAYPGRDRPALHRVGARQRLPGPDQPARLRAQPSSDQERFGGLTACDTRREVYGAERRAILTHSPELHESQARGFDGTTLAKAGRKLDELAATLARGKTRRPREKVEAEIAAITAKPWVRRVITWQLSGEQPQDLRLTWQHRPRRPRRPGRRDLRQARADHRPRRLAGRRGRRRLPVPVRGRVLLPAAQRPARGVLLPDVPLDRAQHPRPRLHLRARPPDRPPDAAAAPAGPAWTCPCATLLGELAGIGETVLLYQAERGRPRAHRMLTDTTPRPGQAQRDLRPRPLRPQALTWVIRRTSPGTPADQRKHEQDQLIPETRARWLSRCRRRCAPAGAASLARGFP